MNDIKKRLRALNSLKGQRPLRKETRYWLIGIGISLALFVLFGMFTAVIPNKFFIRMTPVGWLEWASLIATSTLTGAFIAVTYYKKKSKSTCTVQATAGGVFGFLTFGCSICNKILVLFLGVTGVLTYFDPLRPFLGVASTALLGGALYWRIKR